MTESLKEILGAGYEIATALGEKLGEAINDAMFAIGRNSNPKITFMQLSFTMSKLIKNR